MHPVTAWWIDTVLGTWEETLKALVREVHTLFLNSVLSQSLQRDRAICLHSDGSHVHLTRFCQRSAFTS